MFSRKILHILSLFYLAITISLLQHNLVFALDNEGLPASYGQSDIEEAKIPDPVKRKPPFGFGQQSTIPPVPTVKRSVNPRTTQERVIIPNPTGTSPVAPVAVQTDEFITQNVKKRIANEPIVASSEIVVTTHNGVVNIEGLVDTAEQKQIIEDLAGSTIGVRAVNSGITVRMPVNIPYFEPTYNTTVQPVPEP